MKPEVLIALAGFFAGLIPYGVGIIIWYGKSTKKRYAAERDFQHLKRNQEQIVSNIAHIANEFDKRFDEIDKRFNYVDHNLLEIKTYLNIHRHHE